LEASSRAHTIRSARCFKARNGTHKPLHKPIVSIPIGWLLRDTTDLCRDLPTRHWALCSSHSLVISFGIAYLCGSINAFHRIGGLGSLIRVGKMVMHKSVMNRVWVPSRTQALHSLDTIKTQKEEASSNSNWRVNGEERSHGIGNTGSTPDYNQQQMLEDSINEFISWSLNPSILMRAKRFPRRG